MRRTAVNCLALALLASPVLAQGTASSPAPGTELGGLVDLYYDFYSTKPVGDAQYRNFDTRHNQFALSMAEVWVSKTPTADSRGGFRLKLNFGPAASNFLNAYEPGGAPYQNIEEAFASYLAPVGKGLQIDFGKFVTPLGAEVIEAKDNANYSRSLLFVLAIPIYHAGVRLNYAATEKVSFMGGVVNGWNNVVENNTGKTLMGGITLKPTGAFSVTETYMAGPEQAGNNDHWRNVSDTIASYTASPIVTLMANYDYGHESYASAASAHWQGIAGYAKIQATKSVTFSPRFEYYDDASGWSTGVVQKLKELTTTLELKANDSLLWRIEYRGDFSDQAVFKTDTASLKKNQQSVGFSLLYSFAAKVQ